jgi:hypothetical protein
MRKYTHTAYTLHISNTYLPDILHLILHGIYNTQIYYEGKNRPTLTSKNISTIIIYTSPIYNTVIFFPYPYETFIVTDHIINSSGRYTQATYKIDHTTYITTAPFILSKS